MRASLSRLYKRHVRPQDDHDHFPSRQLFVLALCRICEPIAFMSIFPYAYRMIETFDLTKDETQISIYAGMLITAFAFAEFSTGIIWGRISDKVGRKPVLLMGLVGTAMSMICFGFARSLPTAILARALGGLLNGNVGVLQTTVAELVTKKEHQPRAYSIMPFVWCLGSIIGPAMGGALAMPCDAYPWLFPRGSLFDRYPFLLPNLVCVIVLIFGITTGLLFLEETHVDKKDKRDRGLEAGRCLLRNIFGLTDEPHGSRYSEDLLSEMYSDESIVDPPPDYRSTNGSPQSNPVTTAAVEISPDVEGCNEKRTLGVGKTFNRQVVLIIIGYGILAYHSVSFDSLMPIFLSEARSDPPSSLSFKVTGGFGLSTKKIGFMMAIQGVYSMIAQLWFFPWIIRRIGTLKAFRTVLLIWPLLYLEVPFMVLIPKPLQTTGIYINLLAKITFHVIAFPSNAILLANAAPSKSVLGSINGAAASTACLARAFGPTLSGLIHSVGLKYGCNGVAWWAGGLVCAVGAFESFFIQEVEGKQDRLANAQDLEEQATCEPLLHSATVDATEESDILVSRNSLDSVDELDLSIAKR